MLTQADESHPPADAAENAISPSRPLAEPFSSCARPPWPPSAVHVTRTSCGVLAAPRVAERQSEPCRQQKTRPKTIPSGGDETTNASSVDPWEPAGQGRWARRARGTRAASAHISGGQPDAGCAVPRSEDGHRHRRAANRRRTESSASGAYLLVRLERRWCRAYPGASRALTTRPCRWSCTMGPRGRSAGQLLARCVR